MLLIGHLELINIANMYQRIAEMKIHHYTLANKLWKSTTKIIPLRVWSSVNQVVSMGLDPKLESHKCEAFGVIVLSISLGAARIFCDVSTKL